MATATPARTDVEIASEINQLRERYGDTQDLYREVCALLFFRHGVTPTANKLYQLVRKGSMSAPAEALARFWESLREKSRVRIEHPDLPPELAEVAGQLIGTLWQHAQTQAQAGFSAARDEFRSALLSAEEQALAAQVRADAAAHALFQLQAEFSANLTRLQELENALAKEQGVCSTLERQMGTAVAQRRELQEALAAARKDFEGQLELQRAAVRSIEERHQTDLKRASLDVARERGVATELQAELDHARSLVSEQAERHNVEASRLQLEIAGLRQELGAAEGSLVEARSARDMVRRQFDKALLLGKAGQPGRRGRLVHRA